MTTDPLEAAAAASLRYVNDSAPGLRRYRAGRGFRYAAPDGSPIRDFATRRRIRMLAIPPAWTNVWICPTAAGHVQAIGRDARGRKQYRYHPRWRETRDATKYARLALFAERLPAIRRHVTQDLARTGLPREKVLATVVGLLESSLIRVGNVEYAETNGSFGLTTLRTRHVRVEGSKVRFEFRGKGGKHHSVDVSDRRLARIVRECQDLPGHELFQYLDEEGQRQAVGSADVNAYLREIAGDEFTAKDFRTWAGSVLALRALRDQFSASEAEARRNLTGAIKTVATRLGNTPAICRKCYVHPAVVAAYMDRGLTRRAKPLVRSRSSAASLNDDEKALLAILRRSARRSSRVEALR